MKGLLPALHAAGLCNQAFSTETLVVGAQDAVAGLGRGFGVMGSSACDSLGSLGSSTTTA